ncbi:MAG: FAD-binding oxidoreductase [Acidobacteriota bacterium]
MLATFRRGLRLRRPPVDEGSCCWLEGLARASVRRVQGSSTAHTVVVGAGFTGLAAARRMAELRPASRIVLVDARRAGDGASGRSSGFLVDLASFIAAMPRRHADRFIRLSRAGIAELRRCVHEHRIACDWDDRGTIHAAAGEAGMSSLTRLSDWLAARGETFQRLSSETLATITGSRFYRAGIRLPGSVIVQAGALVRGLATNLPKNVELLENSPVHAIGGGNESGEPGGMWRVFAGDGSIRTPRVILALNGYSAGLGLLPCRVFPLLTFGSLTQALTADQQARLGGEREWGILAQDPMGSSVRRTRDQRLLIRNTVHYQPGFRAGSRWHRKAVRSHRLALERRFPELAELELAGTWSGVMGISPNAYPFFGRLAPNLVTTAGFTACGIAMGTISGRLLADQLLAQQSDLLADRLSLPGPSWIPPEPFLSVGLPLVMARKNALAGAAL